MSWSLQFHSTVDISRQPEIHLKWTLYEQFLYKEIPRWHYTCNFNIHLFLFHKCLADALQIPALKGIKKKRIEIIRTYCANQRY